MVKHPPDILITTPESLYLMLTSRRARDLRGHRDGDPRRDPRRRADQARRAPGADAGAAGRAGGARRAARRAVARRRTRWRRSAASWPARGRRVQVVDTGVRKPLDLKIHVPVESMVEPEQLDTDLDPFAGQEATRKSIWPAIYPELLEARARAPLDADLRQQPARGRAARAALERAGGGGHRALAPRLAGARGAAARRGAAEGGRAAVPGRHLLAGARHRHGRDRPRAAGRVAEVGHRRAAADRPRRPQRRRRLEGPHLPEVPRRPARVHGRRAAHARGADRDDGRPAQPARRAGAADRRDGGVGRGSAAGRRAAARSSTARTPTRSCRARSSRTCSTCSTGAIRRRSSASCGRGSCGIASRGRSARARARVRWRSRTPARSRTAGCSPSTCPDGRRVGELDEEMVYEARPGQVFLLGASSWRIEEITRDRVIVTPAPGVPGAVPFWKGDGLGRPRELGEAIGKFARWAVDQDPATARARLRPGPSRRRQPGRVPP